MERKIGEIFEYNGEWYQCIAGNDCENCPFNERKCYTVVDNGDPVGECCADRRKDNKDVIFKKLEKVGEPFSCNYYGDNRLIMMQEYNLFNLDDVTNEDKIPMYITDYKHKRIAIEIKQTKEDMEEQHSIENYPTKEEKIADQIANEVGESASKQLKECMERMEQCSDNRFEIISKAKEALLKATNIANDEKEMAVIDNILFRCWQMGWLKEYEEEIGKLNLKEFNLEAAKLGKPICTRDGKKARIICFDRVTNSTNEHTRSLVVLIPNPNGDEHSWYYTNEGTIIGRDEYDDYDLMMLPEKKEGWAVIRKDDIYETEEQAEDAILNSHVGAMIRKITWEE